jgi:hypothetical protein
MKAVITTSLNSGLGDMYLGIYQIYYLQEELKKIGYNVTTIIDLRTSPYKTIGSDRTIFKRIFKLELLDNLEIVTEHIGSVNDRLRESLNEVYKYEHIHTVFVNTIIDGLKDIKHVKHSWYYSDDLPKINLLSNEVTKYCEEKSKEIGGEYVGLHYRPFSSDDVLNIESDLEKYKELINKILDDNQDKIVFLSTNKEPVKEYLRNSEYKNYYINNFTFPTVHDGIRSMDINDDELYEILKESLCDMYLLSKCEKIYRISDWFSAFLSFTCLYNQTNISNRLRFYPEHPVIPL